MKGVFSKCAMLTSLICPIILVQTTATCLQEQQTKLVPPVKTIKHVAADKKCQANVDWSEVRVPLFP